MKPLSYLVVAVFVLGLAACGTSVKRVDSAQVEDVSGHWNDTDSQQVANDMITDCLSRPWYSKAKMDNGHTPTVIVGTITNQSSEHINTDTFVENLQSSLINSGKVAFVASANERGDVRQERTDQDVNASADTRKARGQETGADYMLSGTINSIVDQEGGKAVVYYQTNLKLLDMLTNQIVWNGQSKIKKVVERSKLGF